MIRVNDVPCGDDDVDDGNHDDDAKDCDDYDDDDVMTRMNIHLG